MAGPDVRTDAILSIRDLVTRFKTGDGIVAAVNGISLDIAAGETIGVVGESGSGKSQLFMSVMGLLASNGHATGSVQYRGQEVLGLPAAKLNRLRGSKMAMIFQDPMTSLNPYLTIARQMTEVLVQHKGMTQAQALKRSVELLDLVRIPEAKRRIGLYPHAFSGGMRQRVMIAMALLCSPDLLIADEPTTALDVTVQAQILDLLRDLKRVFNTSIVLITHDLGVIAGLADRVMVMYAGKVIETGPVRDIFYNPQHPYTEGLLQSMPRLNSDRHAGLPSIGGQPPNLQDLPPGCNFQPRCRHAHARCLTEDPRLRPCGEGESMKDKNPAWAKACYKACHLIQLPLAEADRAVIDADRAATHPQIGAMPNPSETTQPRPADLEPILSVRDLSVHFAMPKRHIWSASHDHLKAVDGISFDLRAGETLGVVGESGCGKSTLGRAVLQLIAPTAGQVVWMGQNIAGSDRKAMREKRQELQIIFQDPLASLNPRMSVGEIIGEPLAVFESKLGRKERQARVEKIMSLTGLRPEMINRYPHEFSGGQAQRIGIARAMILNPKLIVCDEPVSALDVSIQSQIINLLMRLQHQFGLSLIFISHDLSVVRHISHRIMVLYLGKLAEIADRDTICDSPRHPYTQALISAVPKPDPDAERGKIPIVLAGDLPSPLNPPSGCYFRARCPKAQDLCAQLAPQPTNLDNSSHQIACHFATDPLVAMSSSGL